MTTTIRCQRCASEIFSKKCELCNATECLRNLVASLAGQGYRLKRLGCFKEVQAARHLLKTYDNRYPNLEVASDVSEAAVVTQ